MSDRGVPGFHPTAQPITPSEATGLKSELSIRELLTELWQNTERLLRQELKLASAELDQKVDRLKREAMSFALGGALLHAGLLALVAALILLLAEAMNPWLAALAVGVALTVVGFVLVRRDPKHIAEGLVPERTLENVKKDVQTLREATK